MPAWSTVLLFVLTALGLLLIPGPNVLYIITRSASQGKRAGMTSVGGVELAGLTHALAAALGLSALLLTSALAFTIVKFVGAAYLIYLGTRTMLAKDDGKQSIIAPKSYSRLFTQGYLVNLLNPKTALFFYAFLPQFVDSARGAVVGQVLFFGVLFVLLATCTDALYALLGSTLSRLFSKATRFQPIRRYVTGGIYIALGVTAAFAGSEKK